MLAICNATIKKRLFNVSIEIPKGVLFGVSGPNGAGKSTLLKAIAGLIGLNAGTIWFQGQNLIELSRSERSRLVHLVPQTTTVPFDYTVLDIVMMGRFGKNTNVEAALRQVDALHLVEKRITQLSMGEKQRVYLARALVTECPILLFDEPTANLDIRHQLEAWTLLQGLAAQDRTIIVTNHDLQMASRFCPRLALLNQGQCHAYGKTQDVLTDQEIEATFGIRRDSQGHAHLIT